MKPISVIHLVWVPAGLAPLERFLASYRDCPGGMKHDLIVIFNGQRTREELAPFEALLKDVPHIPLPYYIPTQDLTSYHQVAQIATQPTLCFLNSYTRLRDADWLAKMVVQHEREGVGVVGASGSWESLAAKLPAERERVAQRGLLGRTRGNLRIAYQERQYPPFPNPHIRTNGFMIRRERLLKLKGMTPRNKEQAWRFECLYPSMTRQIQAQGLRPLVVGRDGTGYEVADWPRSNTFRQGDQGNLLMSDNRSQEYDAGTLEERCTLWRNAWGDEGGLPPR